MTAAVSDRRSLASDDSTAQAVANDSLTQGNEDIKQ